MDEFTQMFLVPTDENDGRPPAIAEEPSTASPSGAASGSATPAAAGSSSAPPSPSPTSPRKRRGIRDFLSKANLQDQLLDKLFQQVIPVDNNGHDDDDDSNMGYGGDGADDTSTAEDDRRAGRAAADGRHHHHHHHHHQPPPQLEEQAPRPPRPGFSVTIMSNNFRRFNARIGVVFRFQKRAERLLAWRHPAHTLALLGVYTIVCLNPYLLTLLPPALLLLGVLIPGFIARHPGTPSTNTPTLVLPAEGYARGPPLAPPRTVKPVKELSRAFFRNMGDLQNSMEDFSVAHDKIVQTVVPATNFADEAFSSALFVVLSLVSIFLSVFAHVLPWRMLLLVGGWAAIGSSHPAVARQLRAWKASRLAAAAAEAAAEAAAAATAAAAGATTTGAAATKPADGTELTPPAPPSIKSLWDAWVAADIILDEPPETREVEIFELQRRSSAAAAEWEPWVFSPSPYDPLSQPRLRGEGGAGGGGSGGGAGHGGAGTGGAGAGGSSNYGSGPTGARFFEDVLPPWGWEWSEKKWALDLWSREWVEERIITGVEVETEGERWVYDMNNEHDAAQAAPAQQTPHAAGGSAGAYSYNETYYGDASDDVYGSSRSGLQAPPTAVRPARQPVGPSWEEGEEGSGRRGEWRRRRWVRLVKRKKVAATA